MAEPNASDGLTQRDLLVRLDTRMEDFVKRIEDHEGRLRALEARPLKWIAGLVTAAISGGALEHYFK